MKLFKNCRITLVLIGIATGILAVNNFATGNEAIEPEIDDEGVQITVLYDNYTLTEGCRADWGFSCMIKGTEKCILFDAGAYGSILLGNMDTLQVDANDADCMVISHNHGDHTGDWQTIGGVFSFLGRNSDVTVYLPPSVPSGPIRNVEATGASVQIVNEQMQLCDCVHLTGPMGSGIIEQSMVLDTPKGLVVLTGCAHPGIVNIVRKAKDMLNKEVYFVFGGFHLMSYSDSSVRNIIRQFKELGVQKVGPSHCTGDRAIELFEQEYGDDFVPMGIGKVTIPIQYDLNEDGVVDINDLVVIIENWGQDGPLADIAPPPFGDGTVDTNDLKLFLNYYKPQTPEPELIAYWALDETEGDIAYDSAGDNDATVHGAMWTEGKIDGALLFDGLNDYVDCGDNELLGPEQMTLSMWLMPEHMGGMRYILSRAKRDSDDIDYAIMRHLTGEIELSVSQPGSDAASVLSQANTPLGEWSHIAVCLDDSEALVYINGLPDNSVSYSERVSREDYRLVISSLRANTRFYSGKIDDVRIYNQALNAEEIEAIVY